MSSEATGYTAAQYLEAGYRAESHGDRERAHQYYAYVADAFPETPEGEAARGGLMRLGIAGSADPHHQAQAAAQQQTAPAAQAQPASAQQQAPRGANGAPHHQGNHPASQPGAAQAPSWQTPPDQRTGGQRARPQAAQQPPPQQGGQRIALGDLARSKLPPGQSGDPHQTAQAAQHGFAHTQHDAGGHALSPTDSHERLPEVVARRQRELAGTEEYEAPARRFRSGRVMAWLFVVGGWLSIAGGIAAVALGFVFSTMGGSVMGVGLGTIAGIGAIVGGLMMVMLGQLALAVFENTEAVREIAALVRMRGDF
ncbi:MAG: hypothetical protein JNM89_12585 [Hyphomicrobiaceae bacterium]|nr:hypothetical protein [Hyphomicrobiaceae bacterium]